MIMDKDITNLIIIIGSLFTQGTILKYYFTKKPLPTQNNMLFRKATKTAITTTFMNLLSVLVGFLKPNIFTIDLHYALNIIYFALYESSFVFIGGYILWNSGKLGTYKFPPQIKIMPTIAAVAAIILTSNYDIFYIDSLNKFHFGSQYYYLNVIPALMLVIPSVKYLIARPNKNSYQDKTMLLGILIILLGIISDNVVTDIIMYEFFFSFFLVIIYIGKENPIFFISEQKQCYNYHAFTTTLNEFITYNKDYYLYGVDIRNFDTIITRRGTETLYCALRSLVLKIEQQYPNTYVFYTDNKCLNVLSLKQLDEDAFINFINESTHNAYKINNRNVYLWLRPILINTHSSQCKNPLYVINAECQIQQSARDCLQIDDNTFINVIHESAIQDTIDSAIQNNRVEVYLQPFYDTHINKINGCEALARIRTRDNKILMPYEFIEPAEKSGLIIELSYAIFENTCKYLSSIDIDEMGLSFVNINCSPVQFQDINLVDKLKAISDKYDIDFSMFNFEVTESTMNNSELMKIHTQNFSKYGASLVMDDFGKGNSNLIRLKDFDFTCAKLDMGLVWDYFDNKDQMLPDVIKLFKRLGLKIVAEGVETQHMVDVLSEMQVDYLQGYYFSKPIPTHKFSEYIKDNT